MCLVSKEELVLLDWLSVGTWFSNRKCTQYAFSISNTMLFHQILPCFSQITSNLSLYININSLTHCRFFLNISGAQQCSSLVLRAIYRSRLIIVSPTHPMWLCSSSTTKSLLMEWNTLNQDLYMNCNNGELHLIW